MKARRSLTEREMKIMQQFPVIGIHQMAANHLEIIKVCRQSIKDCDDKLAELYTENPITMYEIQEFQDTLNAAITHITFCEKTLYDSKIALNDITWALN